MKRLRDEAYVLGTYELGEADLIVTLLAQQHGKVRGVARSARSSRRRFGGALEPLSHVEAVWVEQEGRDLARIEALETVRSFAVMQGEPLRQAACAVLVEVSSCLAQEGHAEPESFRLLAAVLDAMERGTEPWVLVRYFEYWLLRIHGLLPDFDCCVTCGRQLAPSRSVHVAPGRGLDCADCARDSVGDRRLATEERCLLAAMRRCGPAQLPAERPPDQAGARIELLLRSILEAYTERSFPSYRHLRALQPSAGDQGAG